MRICTRSSRVQLKYLGKEELTETNYRNFKHFLRSRKLFRRSSMFVLCRGKQIALLADVYPSGASIVPENFS